MKKIRLEFPLGTGREGYLPKKIWLKVSGNKTEAFEDRNFTIPVPATGKKVSIEVAVPEKLELIEIVKLGGFTPDNDISSGWCKDEADPNWRVPGLQKVTIIFDDRLHEVPVMNERPDREEWDNYRATECGGWLWAKTWALAVYTLETQTIAAFHWHPKLIRELEAKRRPIQLSDRNKLPCMWEKGGQIDDYTGNATIICNANGNKMKPIFIKKRGTLACSEHALIVVHENDIIIEVAYQKCEFHINVLKIIGINSEECEAEVEYITKWSYPFGNCPAIREYIETLSASNWSNRDIAKKYKNAILAAYDKATCYHCRKPYFVRITESIRINSLT